MSFTNKFMYHFVNGVLLKIICSFIILRSNDDIPY